jgi:hypothetical protein
MECIRKSLLILEFRLIIILRTWQKIHHDTASEFFKRKKGDGEQVTEHCMMQKLINFRSFCNWYSPKCGNEEATEINVKNVTTTRYGFNQPKINYYRRNSYNGIQQNTGFYLGSL